jgi:hypothetical protein
MSKTIEVSVYRGRTWLIGAEMQGPIKTENPACADSAKRAKLDKFFQTFL